jgi:AraC family transcriptional regulator
MDNSQSSTWQADAVLFDNIVEASHATPAFDVKIHRTRWLRQGSAFFEPSMHFVEMVMSSKSLVYGSYSSRPTRSEHVALGDVAFMPKNARLHCAIEPGTQRSISCLFDVDALAERTGMEWRLPEFDLTDGLSIGNEYVRAGLRRIADELVSPGFASAAQIECSLVFIAMELMRILDRSDEARPAAIGSLTKRQLSRLCAIIVDSVGDTPTLGELASETGMCPQSLASAFRKTTGETLRSFLANSRLERAKKMLLDRSRLVKQVAYDCGFKNAASFTAAFRKATGMTPGDYRALSAA